MLLGHHKLDRTGIDLCSTVLSLKIVAALSVSVHR